MTNQTEATNTTEANIVLLTQDVHKRNAETKEREKVGDYTVAVPTVAAFIAAVNQPATGVDDDGLPTYDDNAATWLQNAITAACRGQARNRLVGGTATLRMGAVMPTTFAELIEPVQSSGNQVLAERAELIKLFVAQLEADNRPAAIIKMMRSLMEKPELLGAQPERVREVMAQWVSEFRATLVEVDAASQWQLGHLDSVLEYASQDGGLLAMLDGF